MSAIIPDNPAKPRKLAILWLAPLQAMSLFAIWAINAGGEILRSWLLTAMLCLMSLPLLLGLEGSLLAMMLFEPMRGLLRRAQYLIVPYSSQDPIHLLTPVVTFAAFIVLLRKERLSIFWATPLAISVSCLAVIFFLEIFNPLQGSLFVGASGALFMLVPVAWFYFGQAASEKFIQRALVLIVALGIIGSLWGVYQLVFGYPAFEQYWIDNTDFYQSIAVGHIRRALATFSSAEEWGRYTEIGAIISVGMAMARQRLAKRLGWGLCAAALIGAILLSGQRTAVFGFVAGAIALIILGAHTWQNAISKLALMLMPFVLVAVFVQAPSDKEIWSKDESETVSTILTHTQRGTLKPAEEESLQIRFENWGYLLTSVIPFRPLGAGIGTSQLADLRENRDYELPPVDNFILVVALACGIPGALIFVWIISRATWFSVQLARADEANPGVVIRRIVAAIMPALILNSIFGLTFSIYSVAPIAWLLIGWISAETLRMRQQPAREIITI